MKNLVKFYTLLALTIVALSPFSVNGQVDIPADCGTTTFDFSGFTGAGFASPAGAGQLDADTWFIDGFSSASDAARGTTTGGVTTGGVYALSNGGDNAFWIQPGGSDFTPGFVKLKACNNSGSSIADIDMSYDILYLNDKDRANYLNFEYSLDDATYTSVPALDFTTPEVADALGIQTVAMSTMLTGVNIPDGGCIYFAWVGDDVSGGGSRDEYGFDNVTFCASGGIAPPPPPPVAPSVPYCIASDDFDSPTNLLSFTTTTDAPFMSLGDFWGVTSPFSGNPIFTPFSVIDDGGNPACANYFPFDNQGIIACDYGNRFFAMSDTENGNNMGAVSAEWVFDISNAVNLTGITVDVGAMGDFESSDVFTISYSIDGGPFTVAFAMSPDESTNLTYTLDNGNTRTLNDPMMVNGVVVGNDLTTFEASIAGAGDELTLRLEGMGNGGAEAMAWDNITIKGITPGVAVPTMGEWAMFLFMMIMISFGVVFLYNAQNRMVLAGAGETNGSINFRQLPFDMAAFKTAMKHACGLAVAGFAFIFLAWGEIVPADLVGMALSIPVMAYLIHVISLFGKK